MIQSVSFTSRIRDFCRGMSVFWYLPRKKKKKSKKCRSNKILTVLVLFQE